MSALEYKPILPTTMGKESPGVSIFVKKKKERKRKREARKMHRVSAMTALKEEKKFSHAKRAEAALYRVYARRQK